MGSENDKNYTIEARQLRIMGAAGHNFFALKDSDGNLLSELHGLAYRPSTKNIVTVGNKDEDLLRAFIIPRNDQFEGTLPKELVDDWNASGRKRYAQDDQPSHVVYSGPDALEHWQAAVNAIPTINDKNIAYPYLGGASTLYGAFFGLGEPTNSNSVYTTFGKLMQVEPFDFSGRVAPGLGQDVLSQEEIERLRHPTPLWDGKPTPKRPMIEENPQSSGLGSDISSTNSAVGGAAMGSDNGSAPTPGQGVPPSQPSNNPSADRSPGDQSYNMEDRSTTNDSAATPTNRNTLALAQIPATPQQQFANLQAQLQADWGGDRSLAGGSPAWNSAYGLNGQRSNSSANTPARGDLTASATNEPPWYNTLAQAQVQPTPQQRLEAMQTQFNTQWGQSSTPVGQPQGNSWDGSWGNPAWGDSTSSPGSLWYNTLAQAQVQPTPQQRLDAMQTQFNAQWGQNSTPVGQPQGNSPDGSGGNPAWGDSTSSPGSLWYNTLAQAQVQPTADERFAAMQTRLNNDFQQVAPGWGNPWNGPTAINTGWDNANPAPNGFAYSTAFGNGMSNSPYNPASSAMPNNPMGNSPYGSSSFAMQNAPMGNNPYGATSSSMPDSETNNSQEG